jgi:putative ABC transport system ATP-binding protein
MNNSIETVNLYKRFNGATPVKNVNISIRQGEFVTLLGPSGAGKSTLLALVAGLERPSEGTVYIDGQDISELSEDQLALLRREKVGFVFQAFRLIPTLPAVENVAFPLYPAKISSSERRALAMDLLKKVGLEGLWKNLPSELSGGERQRVAIARALINKPKLIFCDEPTGNLDSKTGQEIVELLVGLNRESGACVLMVTHDEKIAQYSERSLFMKDGEVTAL